MKPSKFAWISDGMAILVVSSVGVQSIALYQGDRLGKVRCDGEGKDAFKRVLQAKQPQPRLDTIVFAIGPRK